MRAQIRTCLTRAGAGLILLALTVVSGSRAECPDSLCVCANGELLRAMASFPNDDGGWTEEAFSCRAGTRTVTRYHPTYGALSVYEYEQDSVLARYRNYGYDQNGRKISDTGYTAQGAVASWYNYVYDSSGRLTELHSDDAATRNDFFYAYADSVPFHRMQYYDEYYHRLGAGGVEAYTDSVHGAEDSSFSSTGLLLSVRRGAETYTLMPGSTPGTPGYSSSCDSFEYDGAGHLTMWILTTDHLVGYTTYEYDSPGNLVLEKTYGYNASSSLELEKVIVYGYADGRLLSKTMSVAYGFVAVTVETYDHYGSVVERTTWDRNGTALSVTSWQYWYDSSGKIEKMCECLSEGTMVMQHETSPARRPGAEGHLRLASDARGLSLFNPSDRPVRFSLSLASVDGSIMCRTASGVVLAHATTRITAMSSDGGGLRPGVYVARINTGQGTQTQRLSVVR